MSRNNYYGLTAENYFLSRMNSLGLETKQNRTWYDFEVNNHKVEVKSCALFVKQKKDKTTKYRSGRFHFTEPENRENQFKENIWVCFITRHNDDFLILGFVRAKNLQKKPKITLSQLGKYRLVPMDKWLIQINKKKKKEVKKNGE